MYIYTHIKESNTHTYMHVYRHTYIRTDSFIENLSILVKKKFSYIAQVGPSHGLPNARFLGMCHHYQLKKNPFFFSKINENYEFPFSLPSFLLPSSFQFRTWKNNHSETAA